MGLTKVTLSPLHVVTPFHEGFFHTDGQPSIVGRIIRGISETGQPLGVFLACGQQDRPQALYSHPTLFKDNVKLAERTNGWVEVGLNRDNRTFRMRAYAPDSGSSVGHEVEAPAHALASVSIDMLFDCWKTLAERAGRCRTGCKGAAARQLEFRDAVFIKDGGLLQALCVPCYRAALARFPSLAECVVIDGRNVPVNTPVACF